MYNIILVRYGEMTLKKANYKEFLKAINTNIKRKLIQSLSIGQKNKIIQLLKTHSSLQEGAFVSTNNLKKILDGIYKSVGIVAKAKAADIENYYHVRVKTPRINDKPVAGFVIIKEKI